MVNVLLPVIVSALVVPPVDVTMLNVCPPPIIDFVLVDDKLIVDVPALNVKKVLAKLIPFPDKVIVLEPKLTVLVDMADKLPVVTVKEVTVTL